MKLWSKPTKLSMKSNLTAPEQPKIFNIVLFFFTIITGLWHLFFSGIFCQNK